MNMKLEEAIKSSTFKDPVQKAAVNVMYTAWWIKSLGNQYLKPFGLTHEQYNVLRILKGKHPVAMCVKDIASRLIEKSSNVPRIIDRLEVKKWVTRGPGAADKRETLVQLTNEGITVLQAATGSMEAGLSGQLQLADKEAVMLNDLLEKLRQNQ
jgi:DNA-binding MarR family transcriptional regulator